MTGAGGRRGPPSLGAVLALETWLFLLIGFAGTSLLQLHPAVAVGVQVLFAGPVIGWTILRHRSAATVLDVAIVLALGAHLVVSLLSLDRVASMAATGVAAAYAGAFWLAGDIERAPRLRRASVLAVVMVVLFWLVLIALTWIGEKVAAVQAFGWPPPLEAYQPYVWGSVNTPPILALLLLPFLAWLPPGAFRRIVVIAWIACSLVIVPLSVGRAAWVGFAVTALVLAALIRWPVRDQLLARLRALGAPGWAAAGLAGAAAVTAPWVFASQLDLGSIVDSRLRLWRQALGLFAQDPVTGAGPTTFGWARLTQVPDLAAHIGARDAHSIPIQTISDGGAILFAATLAIVGAWAIVLVRRRHGLDARRRLAIGVLAGYAAASLFDDLSFLPAVVVLSLILAAWSVPPAAVGDRSDPRARTSRLLVPVALALVVAMAGPWALQINIVRLETESARQAALRGDWDRALAGFQRAAEGQPDGALHWMSIGLAASRLDMADVARDAYAEARRINPGDARPWGALAALEPDEAVAVDLLMTATRRSSDPQYAYRLATQFEGRIGTDAWSRHMAIAVIIEPRILASLGEDRLTDVATALHTMIFEAGSRAPRHPRESLWDASLALGGLVEDAPVQWQLVDAAQQGRHADAERLLSEAIRLDRHWGRTYEAAAALARFQCDPADFEEATRRFGITGPDTTPKQAEIVDDRRTGLYREPELGDYQPLRGPRLPTTPAWPFGLIEAPDCDW